MRSPLHFIALSLLFVAGCKTHTTDADNTAKNSRDNVPTADQAAQSGNDLDLTASVRKALVDADGLSTNATNAKIVVDKGVVTLIGPVASAEEKARVESLALKAGATKVVNQLEITN
jgi:hyperosmotically inducible protein